MAQVSKQPILVGLGRSVGTVSVDGGAIRAEGGPGRPQLIVPVTITMAPQPANAMIAVTRLSAQIATDSFAEAIICQPISQELGSVARVHSIPSGSADFTVHLRFFLVAADVEDLERRRHATSTDGLQLYLRCEPTVAAVTLHNTLPLDQASKPTPWDLRFGEYALTMPFWSSRVAAVPLQVEQSTWVRNVLPGLGRDRLRLLELELPPALPDHASAAAQFDRAKRALDERRYSDCIKECRGLLNMWEKQYGATAKRRVADLFGDERHWSTDDIRRKLLDTLWKEIGDFANAPHHPEGDVDSELFEARDARLLLILTAALSEYLGRS